MDLCKIRVRISPMLSLSFVHVRTISIGLLWTLSCVGAGFALKTLLAPSSEALLGTTLRLENAPYPLIDPLLGCGMGSTASTPSLNDLQARIDELLAHAQERGDITDASMYVRDMASGAWTGVNQDALYTPASLFKVPVLIAYLKQAESNPDLLSYTVTVTEDPAEDTAQDIPPPESVEVGKTYSLEELLKLMIVDSDNRALDVLMNYIDTRILRQTFDDLDIPFPEDATTYTISPRIYSRFFRVLYNATYLSPASSQKALLLLSKVAFTSGIRAGVPEDIFVAHKFGEAPVVLSSGEQGHELHDCGMVYAESPYALCVMTRGSDVDALTNVLRDISEATYAFMQNATP